MSGWRTRRLICPFQLTEETVKRGPWHSGTWSIFLLCFAMFRSAAKEVTTIALRVGVYHVRSGCSTDIMRKGCSHPLVKNETPCRTCRCCACHCQKLSHQLLARMIPAEPASGYIIGMLTYPSNLQACLEDGAMGALNLCRVEEPAAFFVDTIIHRVAEHVGVPCCAGPATCGSCFAGVLRVQSLSRFTSSGRHMIE